jgi:hypothetical protein
VANAELDQESINSSCLYAVTPTDVAYFGVVDMVLPFGHCSGSVAERLYPDDDAVLEADTLHQRG